jgi:hypothetical protein
MSRAPRFAFDVVYYWTGGTVAGRWATALLTGPPYGTAATLDELRGEIRRGGRVAHKGSTAIGPPEGPPSEAELAAVLSI